MALLCIYLPLHRYTRALSCVLCAFVSLGRVY
jgi:hypothetical protein